jgi:polyvinyl alcohol dehydrogenase (cytochrome)
VLALDKVTGAIVWSTRLSETDAWTLACLFQSPVNCPIPTGPDFDFGQAPIIFGENSMVIGQKSGVVWGLNRLTGQVRWNTTVDLGGYLGGFMWGGSLAADSYNSLTWIGASANSQFKPTTVNGQTFTGSSIVGINPINGNINWRTEVPLPNNSYGAISSTVEVAFAPAYQSGIMTAYSVKTGEILWSYQTNATLHGGPAISGKRVIFGNGYQAAFGGTPGHNVYCFKLAEYDCDC